jgi:hypothetical protein
MVSFDLWTRIWAINQFRCCTRRRQNVFLQVSGLQLDDKYLLQVKQSFACRSPASVHGEEPKSTQSQQQRLRGRRRDISVAFDQK